MGHESSPSENVVLVVEDEALVRMVTVDMLSDAGFSVIEADSADAAMPILDARADIALIVTDVRMPGTMDGIAFAHHVAERFDRIGILVTSGHARPALDELPARARFIGKPYRAEVLLDHLHQLAAGATR